MAAFYKMREYANRKTFMLLHSILNFNKCNHQIYFFAVTGNANYRMTQTSFTFLGLTQPQTALPNVQDDQNNAKGFMSGFLCFFPQPLLWKLGNTELTPEQPS